MSACPQTSSYSGSTPPGAAGTVRIAERLPAGFGPISIRNLRLGEHLVTINANDREVDVSGLGDLRLLRDPVR
jgi:hypothetical protein